MADYILVCITSVLENGMFLAAVRSFESWTTVPIVIQFKNAVESKIDEYETVGLLIFPDQT